MSKIFKIEKYPHEEDVKLFSKSKLEIEDNIIYCLVGCNGSGKTTLINEMINQLKEEGYKNLEKKMYDFSFVFNKKEDSVVDKGYIRFDKKSDNNSNENDYILNNLMGAYSSTGESIIQRYGRTLQVIVENIRKGEIKDLWIFFDDCDAGTSIDMIIDIKDVINLIKEDCGKRNIIYHIILTANSFEMCKDINSISVHDFKPRTFKNYNTFKNFVLKSREIKNKRDEGI